LFSRIISYTSSSLEKGKIPPFLFLIIVYRVYLGPFAIGSSNYGAFELPHQQYRGGIRFNDFYTVLTMRGFPHIHQSFCVTINKISYLSFVYATTSAVTEKDMEAIVEQVMDIFENPQDYEKKTTKQKNK